LIAEFLGTLVLMLFGTGVVAMVVLFPSNTPAATVHGGCTNITLGWGLAVTMGVYVAGKVSAAISTRRSRDVGPRLFTAVAGFRNNGLTDGPRVW
jgi:glycerol uptake facilitator-like aquaporin